MFSAFQTFGRLGAGARAVAAAWTPAALWPTGTEAGMWIDPSNLTSQWQDSTGTTPVVTPGTVADSSNPVGLALDIRAGAPGTLGPELVTGAPSVLGGNWTDNGNGTFTGDGGDGYVIWSYPASATKWHEASFTIDSRTSGSVGVAGGSGLMTAVGTYTMIMSPSADLAIYGAGFLGVISGISFKEIPGNHLLQATSTARPLLSARVNLLQYTEDFTNGYWVNATATVTPNYGTAPDGTQTSTRLVFPGANNAILKGNILAANVPSTSSCWVKGPAGETLQFEASLATANLVTLTGSWQLAVCEHAAGQSFVIGTYGGATARDVEVWHPQFELGTTATPYQAILTDGSTYTATGITPWQLYDGTDDGMATASFAAGTLSNAMDCMIAVRRDSAAQCVAGLYSVPVRSIYFGHAAAGSGGACAVNVGTPTVWVDGVQLTGGTSVEPGTLNTALTVGEWHIMEFRGLDLSAITQAGWGDFGSGFSVTGARGDIMLYPSTASTEDKDAARQYLADKYGVTLA